MMAPSGSAIALSSEIVERIAQEIKKELLKDAPNFQELTESLGNHFARAGDQTAHLVRQIVAHVNAALFPPVTQMELVHTEGCNLACTYCFEKDVLGYRRMNIETGRAAIDLLFEYAGDARQLSITHFGGEPTLNFPAVQATTEYAESKARSTGKEVSFNLTSNGTRLTEPMAEYFAEHRIMVLLSMDGRQATHDRFRIDKHGRGTFDSALSGLKLLKRTQRWIGVKMTVMPANVDTMLEDVMGLRLIGVNQFVLGHATGVQWTADALEKYVEQWSQVYSWYKLHKGDELRISEFDELSERPEEAYFGCQAGRNSISISVNGEISPCSKILASNNRELLVKLGDVRFGLTHVRNRAELNTCGKLQSSCDEHGIGKFFAGGCWASNYSDTGDLFKPSLQDHRFTVLQSSACGGCGARSESM